MSHLATDSRSQDRDIPIFLYIQMIFFLSKITFACMFLLNDSFTAMLTILGQSQCFQTFCQCFIFLNVCSDIIAKPQFDLQKRRDVHAKILIMEVIRKQKRYELKFITVNLKDFNNQYVRLPLALHRHIQPRPRMALPASVCLTIPSASCFQNGTLRPY